MESKNETGGLSVIFDVPFNQVQSANFELGQPRFTINGEFYGLVFHASQPAGSDPFRGLVQMDQSEVAAAAAGIGDLRQILLANNVENGHVKTPFSAIMPTILGTLFVFAVMFLVIMFLNR